MAQRHLADCARCRAAVVAAASGLRGPGETIVMMRRVSATAPAGVKVAAVAVSLMLAGLAWGYGAAPKPAESSRAPEIGAESSHEVSAAPANDPAALREATPLQIPEPGLPLELPAAQDGNVLNGAVQDAAVQDGAAHDGAVQVRAVQVRAVQDGAAREDAPPVPPTVTVVTSAAAVERPRSRRRRKAPPPARTLPAVEESAKPDDEVDFGIDEPAPRIRKHVRTTLD